MSEYILRTEGIVKTFPGVKALKGVNLKVRKGEVHAIVGENGAGKSTLILTLGGVHIPDSGQIFLENEPVAFRSAKDAQEKGIGTVFQELSLTAMLSVAENIYANRQPVNKLNFIDKKTMYANTTQMLSLFRMEHINPSTVVSQLSIANQQIVEILKAISFNPKVLILDEPTSSLTEQEVAQLFKNIEILKAKGISIIYISHHLKEIFKIADHVTVLRDGEYICDEPVASIDEEFLITKMVGRKIENIYGIRDPKEKIGEEIFRCESIASGNSFKNISFGVRAGEIVGFSGLIGAGRTEIGRSIFGAEPITQGKMYLEGEPLTVSSPREGISKGIGYMSEDRKLQGLYLDFSIKENLIANRLDKFSPKGFIDENLVKANANEDVEKYKIVTPSIDQKVSNLSGGNQQKVLLSQWVGIQPKLLIVDEPTRGVDVGAKSEIYAVLRKLAATGVGIILISSDLPEVIGVSDRILVLKEGRITGEVSKADATEEKIIGLAASSEA